MSDAIEKHITITLDGTAMSSENKGQVIKIGHGAQEISPTKMFQTSAAACSLGTFRIILENSKIPYDDLTIRSTMTLAEARPHKIQKLDMTITVTGAQADADKLALILKMTIENCTVVQSIKDVIEVNEHLEIK